MFHVDLTWTCDQRRPVGEAQPQLRTVRRRRVDSIVESEGVPAESGRKHDCHDDRYSSHRPDFTIESVDGELRRAGNLI
jgi:hypothetical protein